MIRITSRKNDNVKRVASLSTAKGRDETGLFITEGVKLYREAVSAGFVPSEAYISDSYAGEEIKAETLYSVTDEVYEKMSTQSSPEGVLCVFEKFELEAKKDSCVLLLENMQDPGNPRKHTPVSLPFEHQTPPTSPEQKAYSQPPLCQMPASFPRAHRCPHRRKDKGRQEQVIKQLKISSFD